MNRPRDLEIAAAKLHTSRETNEPISSLFRGVEQCTIDDAYAVQNINTGRWLHLGRKISGLKIGLTSKAVQQQFNVDQPDFGVLFSDMQRPAEAPISIAQFMQPRIEVELAFEIARPIN